MKVEPNGILVDHSTLNSVARLIENTATSKRDAPVRRAGYYGYIYKYSTTIDIASLGDFVEGVLAHEKVYYFRQSNRKYRWETQLLGPQSVLTEVLEPVYVPDRTFQVLNEQSLKEIQRWRQSGGLHEFGDALLKMLGGVFDPRFFTPSPWADVAMSLRDAEESDQFAEFAEEAESLFLELFAHMKGVHYHGFDNRFGNFVRLIFTLCFRASLYKWLSFSLGVPYSPYVVRGPLVLNSMLASPSILPADAAEIASRYVERLREQTVSPVEELLGRKLQTFTFPVFLPYIASKCSSIENVLEMTVELRSDPQVEAFREWTGKMNELMASKGLEATHNLTNELDRWSSGIRRRLGLEGRKITIVLGPLEFELQIPNFLERIINPSITRPMVFLREVADSVLAVDDAKVWNIFGMGRKGFGREAVLGRSRYDW